MNEIKTVEVIGKSNFGTMVTIKAKIKPKLKTEDAIAWLIEKVKNLSTVLEKYEVISVNTIIHQEYEN